MAKIDLGRVVGLSAYEIAVRNGFVGTEKEWLNSLKDHNCVIDIRSLSDNDILYLKQRLGVVSPSNPEPPSSTDTPDDDTIIAIIEKDETGYFININRDDIDFETTEDGDLFISYEGEDPKITIDDEGNVYQEEN